MNNQFPFERCPAKLDDMQCERWYPTNEDHHNFIYCRIVGHVMIDKSKNWHEYITVRDQSVKQLDT